MLRLGFLIGFASLAVVTCSGAAQAASYEQYCNIRGFAPALRQTIIVLDERQVAAENGDANDTRNSSWRRFIGRLVNFDASSQLEQRFMPRERLTLLLARKDGSGLSTVFTGCLPMFSAAEENRAAKDAGFMDSIDRFFGTGLKASADRDADLFISSLGQSIREAIQPAALSSPRSDRQAGGFESSGLVTSLKQSAFANLNRGIPRILFLSDLSGYLPDPGSDLVKARTMGQSAGRDAGLNLNGAEVYVIGTEGHGNPRLRDALGMFFLSSHAALASMGSYAAVPDFAPAPARVVRYQGVIQFPDRQYPVRIRLVTDQNGAALDSWMWVETANPEFVPINGTLTCQAGTCSFAGDQIFAQAWSLSFVPSSGKKPLFDASLPFGGARTLEFTTSDDYIRGDISDPSIKYQSSHQVAPKANKLHFFATYSSGVF